MFNRVRTGKRQTQGLFSSTLAAKDSARGGAPSSLKSEGGQVVGSHGFAESEATGRCRDGLSRIFGQPLPR